MVEQKIVGRSASLGSPRDSCGLPGGAGACAAGSLPSGGAYAAASTNANTTANTGTADRGTSAYRRAQP